MRRPITTLGILAAAAVSGHALASPDTPAAAVTSIQGDCDPTGIRAGMTELGQGRVAFGLAFQGRSFQVIDEADDGIQASKHCDVAVEVQVPRGYRLRIEAFSLEGYVRANGDSTAYVEASYGATRANQASLGNFAVSIDIKQPLADAMAQDPRMMAGSALGVAQGPWVGKYDATTDAGSMMQSECGETITLASSLSLNASKAGAGGPANIALFKGDEAGRVEWGWRMVPCTDTAPWFSGAWHTRYSASGHWIAAGMAFYLPGAGQFTTADWTGDLTVERFDAQEVVGTWRAPGQSGWFKFDLDQSGRSFRGAWGRQPGHEEGSWSGER